MSDVMERAPSTTELVVTGSLNASTLFAQGGVEAVLRRIEDAVRAEATSDISTSAGRKAVASLAYKVARSKTTLDDMGKEFVADLKKQTGAVDAERKNIRDRLDALRDEVRQPLDDWESAEAKRVADHEAALIHLEAIALFEQPEPALEEINKRISYLAQYAERDWQEYEQRAVLNKARVSAALSAMCVSTERREADRIELEKLRAAQTKRDQQERDDKIAADATAKALAEAETRAAEDRARLERDRADAQARADQAERDTIAAAEKAETDRIAALAKAASDTAAAVAATEKVIADNLAARAAAADAIEEAERLATADRIADKTHKAKINREALAALTAAGISEQDAKTAIKLIASGKVPHVSIAY